MLPKTINDINRKSNYFNLSGQTLILLPIFIIVSTGFIGFIIISLIHANNSETNFKSNSNSIISQESSRIVNDSIKPPWIGPVPNHILSTENLKTENEIAEKLPQLIINSPSLMPSNVPGTEKIVISTKDKQNVKVLSLSNKKTDLLQTDLPIANSYSGKIIYSSNLAPNGTDISVTSNLAITTREPVDPISVYNIYFGDFSNMVGERTKLLVDYFAVNSLLSSSVKFEGSIDIAPSLSGTVINDMTIQMYIYAAITSNQIPANPNGVYAIILPGDTQMYGWSGIGGDSALW